MRTNACSAEGGSLPPEKALFELAERLGHTFRNTGLLEQALTHSSAANEQGDPASGNERLEFLGDAVLDLLISEALMQARPDDPEGRLSKARAHLVNTEALARHARELGLDAAVELGRGEHRSGGRTKPRVLANVFEAVLGALYLDGGIAPCRAFVRRQFDAEVDRSDAHGDAKTRLQELLQQRGQSAPAYEVLHTEGPDHERVFEVGVHVSGALAARGTGRSKRAAEQAAAAAALAELEA